MNKLVKFLFLFAVLFGALSCNRMKTTQVINESYADGNPKVLTEYIVDEKGKKTLYKEIRFFPGEKKFVEIQYDPKGLWDGICASWYENGNKNSEMKYVNGKEDGKYRVWHPNGKLYIKGQYDMGRKTGVWEIYDSLGVKTKEENFK